MSRVGTSAPGLALRSAAMLPSPPARGRQLGSTRCAWRLRAVGAPAPQYEARAEMQRKQRAQHRIYPGFWQTGSSGSSKEWMDGFSRGMTPQFHVSFPARKSKQQRRATHVKRPPGGYNMTISAVGKISWRAALGLFLSMRQRRPDVFGWHALHTVLVMCLLCTQFWCPDAPDASPRLPPNIISYNAASSACVQGLGSLPTLQEAVGPFSTSAARASARCIWLQGTGRGAQTENTVVPRGNVRQCPEES